MNCFDRTTDVWDTDVGNRREAPKLLGITQMHDSSSDLDRRPSVTLVALLGSRPEEDVPSLLPLATHRVLVDAEA